MAKKLRRKQKVRHMVDLVRRLHSFRPDEAMAAAARAPDGIFRLEVHDWTYRGQDYRTTKLRLSDNRALKRLNLEKFSARRVRAPAIKAAELLQREMAFEPEVVAEVQNLLPAGMVELGVGGETAANNVGFNFQCKRLPSGEYWPTYDVPYLEHELRPIR